MVMSSDVKHVLLLTELRKDARKSLTNISSSIDMPISTVHDRMKLNQEGVITKFTCMLDFSKLGFSCRAQVILKVNKADKDAVREHLLRTANINSLYRINNGYDFLLEGVFRDLKGVDDFLERLEERFRIREKKIYYIMEDLARETFLTDPHHIEIVGT